MRPRMAALLLTLAACSKEPEEPEITVRCTQSLIPMCDYEACCEGDEAGRVLSCWYETAEGDRIDCAAPDDCAQAAEDVACEWCDACAGTSTYRSATDAALDVARRAGAR